MNHMVPSMRRAVAAVCLSLMFIGLVAAQVSAVPRADVAGAASRTGLHAPAQATQTCVEECQELGAIYFDQCVRNGGGDAECAAKANQLIGNCRLAKGCGPSSSITNTTPTATTEGPVDTAVPPTFTPTRTSTPTLTPSPSANVTPTNTAIPTLTLTPTATLTRTPGVEITPTQAPTLTVTPAPTATLTTCQKGCIELSQFTYDQCIVGGGTPQACTAQAQEVLRQCLRVKCGIGTPTPVITGTLTPTPVPCLTVCLQRMQAEYSACIAAGNTTDECTVRARKVYSVCALECPTATPVPVTEVCRQKCLDVANKVFLTCQQDPNKSAQDCRNEFQRALDTCLLMNCFGSPTPQFPNASATPPIDTANCFRLCENDFRRKQAECVRISDSEKKRACRDRAQQEFLNCRARCQGTPVATATRTPFPRRP